MKNTFLILITVLLSQLTFSQIKSGEVTYKIRTTSDFNHWVDSVTAKANDFAARIVKEDMEKTKKTLPFIHFTLKFNRTESVFKKPNTMKNDNGLDLNSATSSAGASGNYYTNTEENINLNQFISANKKWIIQTKINPKDWQITGETKKIQGYTCKKATAIVTLNPRVSSAKGKITAWFTPELPFHFGPLQYYGLPGLILGLERNHYYFYADEIKLSKKNKKIKRPDNGKLITKEEYNGKIKKRH